MTGSTRPTRTAGPSRSGGATSGTAKRGAAKSGVRSDRAATSAPASPEIARAQAELDAARGALARELDGLSAATRSSLDIPARIRREPLKTAAIAGGAGFLVLGGPKRLLRAAGRRLLRRKGDPYEGLLPEEIERILRDSGAAAYPGVRAAVATDFAEYLRTKSKAGSAPSARTSFWRTYDAVIGPVGTVGARVLVERLFAAQGGPIDAEGR